LVLGEDKLRSSKAHGEKRDDVMLLEFEVSGNGEGLRPFRFLMSGGRNGELGLFSRFLVPFSGSAII